MPPAPVKSSTTVTTLFIGSRGSYQFKPERERSKSENHNPISITHPHVYTGIGGLFIVYVGSLLGLLPLSFLDPIS